VPNCPLCRSDGSKHYASAHDIEYYTKAEAFDFYHCEPCGILFIDPMLADRLGEIYPKNYYSFSPSNRSLATAAKEALDRRRFRKQLGEIPGEELSLLDIGGGRGWLLDVMRSVDPRVKTTSVVDFDEEAGALAEQAGHRYYQGRFEDVDPAGAFDLILMLNVIEHVTDPRAMLLKARSLLKPGGRILVHTPNFDALDARLFRNRSWAGYHTPRHFVLFTRESMERLSRECGLRTARFGYTQGAPFWSVSILEELRRLDLVSISAERPAIYHPLIPLLQIGSAAFDILRRPFAKLSQMECVLTPLE
jgi:2-polyprenyl-3-methyl-5-hydroxy-6-metoxy-1,4-benzoquinol methylase